MNQAWLALLLILGHVHMDNAGDVEEATCQTKVCPRGEFCEMRVAPCFNPPCPVLPRCVDLCEDACKKGQKCHLKKVVCMTSPCNPIPVCCNAVMCALYCKNGFQKDDNGCDICKCNPPKETCENKTCPSGEFCEMKVAPCLVPPCPEFPTCVNPCEAKRCSKDEVCVLEKVICKKLPCNPVAVCKAKDTCPELPCDVDCGRFGHKLDDKMCPTCKCNKDPCKVKKCKRGLICETNFVKCNEPTCPAIATCIANPEMMKCRRSAMAKGRDRKPIFCGRGPSRQDCPSGFECNISPTDRFAVCCPKTKSCKFNGHSYEPGETFMDSCKKCRCRENGRVICARTKCSRVCTYNGRNYKIGQWGIPAGDGCNTCVCNADGQVGCTRMACKKCEHLGQIYKPNDEFKAGDGCNYCHCSATGAVRCTTKICSTGNCVSITGNTFRNGQSYQDDCNTCYCVESRIKCTRKSCENTCKYNGKVYNDGQKFKSDDRCNECVCNKGITSCTEKACIGSCMYEGKQYSNGASFSNGCTNCKCANGKVRCPRKKCPSCSYNGKTYKQGEQFTAVDGCNHCTCFKGQRRCTKMKCQQMCQYNNQIYKDGASFPSTDTCNKCMCKSGTVGCTKKACFCEYNGQRYRYGTWFPAGDNCNRCTCDAGGVSCTEKDCSGSSSESVVDCSLVDCRPPKCRNGQAFFTPPGECCQQCGQDCRLVRCANVQKCDDGSTPVKPQGKCCLQCPTKPPLSCYYKGKRYPPGHFKTDDPCKSCSCQVQKDGSTKVECAMKACSMPLCKGNARPVRKDGQCCPSCPEEPACYYKGKSYPPGDFKTGDPCKSCTCNIQRDGSTKVECAVMACSMPLCKGNAQPVIKDGQCCPSCPEEPDCSARICLRPVCPEGVSLFTPKGECCPQCGEDCRLVRCAQVLDCEGGAKSYIPPGKCCAQCPPPPRGCEVDGTVYKIGEEIKQDSPCMHCTCEINDGEGFKLCAIMDCAPPPCENPFPIEGRCCPMCNPREQGVCKFDGKYFANGSSFPSTDGCNTCKCEDNEVICTLIECGCEKDGQSYQVGDKIPSSDPCEHCSCTLQDGKPKEMCAIQDCARPQCDDYIRLEGRCCPVCDKQGVCEYNNKYYADGATFPSTDGCNRCTCGDGSVSCTERACGCIWKGDGQFYAVGSTIDDGNPCSKCMCEKQETGGFGITCAIMACDMPECPGGIEPVPVDGACCPQCPKGCLYQKADVSKFYALGASVDDGDPCTDCTCLKSDSGSMTVVCNELFCDVPECPGGETVIPVDGECCPGCPP
ncbi:unnamed protein product [Owenia fusiformis]|uniref:Kielin/chordin-like protein n=1 Tax=Owenia fusiformis TaxID=6347 RepID=A0A8S4P1W4_OWEFU|nr:unnamed protein product [Owenia fusiformis]